MRIFFGPTIDRGASPGPSQHVAAMEGIVGHKSLPLALDAAIARLPAFSGQLAGYASAISAASALPLRSAWIRLPLLGVVAELDCGGPAPNAAKGGIERA